jgi:hypothetical protein
MARSAGKENMRPYLLAAILFAVALYLWFTPPSVEPMQLRAGPEMTVEEYRGDASAPSSGDFVPNNAKQKQPGHLPGCDPCAGKYEQRLNEEQAVFDNGQCTRGSAYNCAVAAEGWRCRLREDAREWGITQ